MLVSPELHEIINFREQTSDQNSPDNRFCNTKSSTCRRICRPNFQKLLRFGLDISNISNTKIPQLLPFPLTPPRKYFIMAQNISTLQKSLKTHLVAHNLVWASPPVLMLIGRASTAWIPYLLDRNFRQLGRENFFEADVVLFPTNQV